MYKVIWLAKFQPDKPREEVLKWWRGHHAELAKVTPGMLRYVQSYWVEALDPATQQPAGKPGAYDGHAEHWFESKEAYEAALASPEWKKTWSTDRAVSPRSRRRNARRKTVISWDRMDDGRGSP